LRIHTTIDRPVLLAGRRYTVDGLFGSTSLKRDRTYSAR